MAGFLGAKTCGRRSARRISSAGRGAYASFAQSRISIFFSAA
jgi:hypothetical protein